MNSAQRKSAPCPERFCEHLSENHYVCGSAENSTRLVACAPVPPNLTKLGMLTKKKGANGGHALWVYASVGHSSGVSAVLSRCRSLSSRNIFSGRKSAVLLAGGRWLRFLFMRQSFVRAGVAHPLMSRISLCATLISSRILSLALAPTFSICSSADKAPLRRESIFSSPFSRSCRRVISASIAVMMKEVVDSPVSFTDSMPSNTSWGIRTFLSCDLLVTFLDAICTSPDELKCCVYEYFEFVYINYLFLYTLSIRLYTHFEFIRCTNSEVRQWWNTNRTSNHQRYHE